MAGASSETADLSGLLQRLSTVVGDLQNAWAVRWEKLAGAPHAASSLSENLRLSGESATWLAGIALASAGFVLLSFVCARRLAGSGGRLRPRPRDGLAGAAAGVAAVAPSALLQTSLERDCARLWGFAAVGALLLWRLIRVVVVRDAADLRLRRLAGGLALVSVFALVGVCLQTTLRRLAADGALVDAVALVFSCLTAAALCIGYVAERHAVRRALLVGREPGPAERRFARAWPWIAAGLVLTTFVVLQVSITLAGPVPGLLVLGSVLFILLAPHLDRMTAQEADGPVGASSVPRLAARRTSRAAFWVFALCCLGMLWISPLSVALGYPRGLILGRGFEIVLLALLAIYFWHLLGAAAERSVASAPHGIEEEHQPATRIATLVPILKVVAQVAIVAFGALSILIALGVNAWPFVAGLSVFGLAIGFGSQSLVKDIVSGIFYLLDDAFRLGEYIETAQAKGTVERISIRSVALRHPRGALATVPYGSIGKVVNFSRDWVIDKLSFRVAFDTDVEVVRKLFKAIGQEIADDPELGPDLLQPFKSQGVFAVDDGTLVIRAKFMARAGRQFMIRKAVLAAVHRGFRDKGIVPVGKFPQTSAGANAAP